MEIPKTLIENDHKIVETGTFDLKYPKHSSKTTIYKSFLWKSPKVDENFLLFTLKSTFGERCAKREDDDTVNLLQRFFSRHSEDRAPKHARLRPAGNTEAPDPTHPSHPPRRRPLSSE